MLVSGLSHLRDVCENATVSLFVMDERQACVYMNPAAELLTGYSLDEVQGAPLHCFVHHTHPDGTPYPLEDCPIDRAAPRNLQEKGHEIFVHKDGTFYPVDFTASPVWRDGVLVGTVIEVQSALARLQLERERMTLQSLSSLILEEMDREVIVQAVTDAATTLTGAQFGAFFYNVRDEAGESYTLYTIAGVPKEKFSRFPLPRATHLFGPTFRGEKAIRSADVRKDPRYGKMAPHFGMPAGHLPVCSYLAVPVSLGNGEIVGGLFFGHELPDRFTESHERLVEMLAAQAALGLNKAALYQEALSAQKRAESDAIEKQRLYEEAARANDAKDHFLATVSHELRTPLTSILGWAQMLNSDKLNETLRAKAVTTIERNARIQAQIVEDLLDISRIVSGKLRLEAHLFNPAPVIEAAIEAIRPSSMTKMLELDIRLDALAGPISGDPERLQQVIWNLLSNAVKFTPAGGKISVVLERCQTVIRVHVCDTGVGIAAENLGRIFETFSQVDPTATRTHGGLGLGLAIVRKLVELHDGSVHAVSAGLGHGTEMIVTLPLASSALHSHPGAILAAPTPPVLPADTAQFGLEGINILLAEDDDDAREMLRSVLHAAGAQVFAAPNANVALTLFDGAVPDLVISDIGMPGMDGYEFIAELRRREHARGLAPVAAVALTAYARIQDRMKALNSGFQMHVAKPVEPVELLTVLASLRSWNGGR